MLTAIVVTPAECYPQPCSLTFVRYHRYMGWHTDHVWGSELFDYFPESYKEPEQHHIWTIPSGKESSTQD